MGLLNPSMATPQVGANLKGGLVWVVVVCLEAGVALKWHRYYRYMSVKFCCLNF